MTEQNLTELSKSGIGKFEATSKNMIIRTNFISWGMITRSRTYQDWHTLLSVTEMVNYVLEFNEYG